MKPKVEINKGKGKTASARKKDVTTSSVVAVRQESSLAERVIELIEAARQKVATVANVAQVYTNYEIGRQIVEEEQGGKRRAEYGKKILIDLSQKLTARFGRGWSVDNLEKMRRFFLLYSQVEISATPLRKFGGNEKSAKGLRKSDKAESSSTICQVPRFTLGWSHYLLLMRIADPVERAFYEREATERIWTFTQLERMYRASTFERLQIAKDKDKVRALMTRPAPDVEVAGEALKDPVVAEFLGTPDKYSEGELEDRIFDHIQDFMLEMGKGFTFHGRQVRCVIGDHSYYADLAFYNRFTRSFFIIDLKLKKVGHDELGQMQTYINYFDRKVKLPDNPQLDIEHRLQGVLGLHGHYIVFRSVVRNQSQRVGIFRLQLSSDAVAARPGDNRFPPTRCAVVLQLVQMICNLSEIRV